MLSRITSRSGSYRTSAYFPRTYPWISLFITLALALVQLCFANAGLGETDGIIVASGDTTQTSTVLWARSSATGSIGFELSRFPDFSDILMTTERNVTHTLIPVKVVVRGLAPGTLYFYRATDSIGASRNGRFSTAAELGQNVGLRFGVTGDWQQAPPFPTLSNTPVRDLDFFIKLGDTIFADGITPALPGIKQARTLKQFRMKHNENISGRFGFNFMGDMYASTSILATIDDHEIVDNFAGGAAPGESPDAPDVHPDEPPLFTDPVRFVNETQAYQDALQAFQKYHPIRKRVWRTPFQPRLNGKPKLYRYLKYGSDAAFFILDARSFRDAPLEPVLDPTDPEQVLAFIASTFDFERTMLGFAQFRRLRRNLLDAQEKGITWKFVVLPEPIQNFGPIGAEDRFEGYAFERSRLLSFIKWWGIENVVFLSADFHGTIVNNLTYQRLLPIGPGGALIPFSIPVPAFEIVSGPVAFFEGLLGPSLVNQARDAGLLSDEEFTLYQSLPVLPDPDATPNDKDDFVKNLINQQLNTLQYDPIGLNENLPRAEGLIDAELLWGDYFATHNFTWTELEIDSDTQDLMVTIWGIEAFSEEDVETDSNTVINQAPFMISRFVVRPQ